jgi:hypothetical protein
MQVACYADAEQLLSEMCDFYTEPGKKLVVKMVSGAPLLHVGTCLLPRRDLCRVQPAVRPREAHNRRDDEATHTEQSRRAYTDQKVVMRERRTVLVEKGRALRSREAC